jgi:hypothetical protein
MEHHPSARDPVYRLLDFALIAERERGPRGGTL